MQRFHQFLSENDLFYEGWNDFYKIFIKDRGTFVTTISRTKAQNFEEESEDRILGILVTKLFT
jgi:hypothetical protein